jgi:hypothetical protein
MHRIHPVKDVLPYFTACRSRHKGDLRRRKENASVSAGMDHGVHKSFMVFSGAKKMPASPLAWMPEIGDHF